MEKGVNWNDYPVFFKRGTYAQRKVIERKLTDEEWNKIPEKHRLTLDRNTIVKRHEIRILDMPIFSKVTNRENVIFEGEDPNVAENAD